MLQIGNEHVNRQKVVNRQYVNDDKAADGSYLFMADYPGTYLVYLQRAKGQRRQTRVRPNHLRVNEASRMI